MLDPRIQQQSENSLSFLLKSDQNTDDALENLRENAKSGGYWQCRNLMGFTDAVYGFLLGVSVRPIKTCAKISGILAGILVLENVVKLLCLNVFSSEFWKETLDGFSLDEWGKGHRFSFRVKQFLFSSNIFLKWDFSA